MKIIVDEGNGQKINLRVPTGLMANNIVASLAPQFLKKYGVELSKQQAKEFVKEIHRYKKTHPGWKLLEVQSSDGEYVEIVM